MTSNFILFITDKVSGYVMILSVGFLRMLFFATLPSQGLKKKERKEYKLLSSNGSEETQHLF